MVPVDGSAERNGLPQMHKPAHQRERGVKEKA
jgi:hypothetical protein